MSIGSMSMFYYYAGEWGKRQATSWNKWKKMKHFIIGSIKWKPREKLFLICYFMIYIMGIFFPCRPRIRIPLVLFVGNRSYVFLKGVTVFAKMKWLWLVILVIVWIHCLCWLCHLIDLLFLTRLDRCSVLLPFNV